jgi:RNA polymerase sigma-B factor
LQRLTETDIDSRFEEWRATGDTAIRNELVHHHRWLAAYCANRFAHRGEPREDLLQVAYVGLVNALDRFDPARGVRFSTFAVPTIMGELRRHFRDRTWPVHVPRRGKELYQVVSAAVDELTGVLGRSPTMTEIADHAGLSVDQALEALQVRGCYRTASFDPGPDDESTDDALLGIDDGGYGEADDRSEVSQLLRALPTRRDRLVIELRFVEGLTQAEIGERIGVSQVQVSRLLQANLERMRVAAQRSAGAASRA